MQGTHDAVWSGTLPSTYPTISSYHNCRMSTFASTDKRSTSHGKRSPRRSRVRRTLCTPAPVHTYGMQSGHSSRRIWACYDIRCTLDTGSRNRPKWFDCHRAPSNTAMLWGSMSEHWIARTPVVAQHQQPTQQFACSQPTVAGSDCSGYSRE